MLKRYEKRIKVFEDGGDEGKDGAYLGYYPTVKYSKTIIYQWI